jgi:hypothetical protein
MTLKDLHQYDAELGRERKKQDAENAVNMARLKEVAPDLHALVDIYNMARRGAGCANCAK